MCFRIGWVARLPSIRDSHLLKRFATRLSEETDNGNLPWIRIGYNHYRYSTVANQYADGHISDIWWTIFITMERKVFDEQLKDLLAHLYDQAYLETSPFLETLMEAIPDTLIIHQKSGGAPANYHPDCHREAETLRAGVQPAPDRVAPVCDPLPALYRRVGRE